MPDVPDDRAAPPALSDLGEDGLLRVIFPRLPIASATLLGPGDDAAVVAAPDGRVVATTDVLVEGRDFRHEWSSAQDVGWKAAAQNLADVAAMGAVPTSLLVGLVAPATLPVAWVLGLADGLASACAGTGAGVVGGDLSAGPLVVVSVTALGDLQGRSPVLRSGARVGEVVAVAGRLGWSAAGWALLEAGTPDAAPTLVAAHRRPQPPYQAGVAAAVAGASAMIDVSDGLVRDLGRVARASGVAVDLDDVVLAEAVQLLRGHDSGLPDRQLWGCVLGGGEDHAIAAVFAQDVPLPEGFVRVGSVVPASSGRGPVTLAGEDPAVVGWDHFGG